MKIAICDDEAFWINELQILLKEYYITRHIDIYVSLFSCGTELLMSKDKFDLIFMDYQMENLNGIETARKIRNLNNNCAIIFVSSYPDIAIDTFEVEAFRFLIKPIDKVKLFKSIDDYRKKIENDDFIVLKSRQNVTILRTSEIIFCEALGRHTLLHTTKGKIESSKNIKEIEKQLSHDYFFRSHKAFISSFSHITGYDNNSITCDNGETAFISRNYLPRFKAAFHEFIVKNNMRKI